MPSVKDKAESQSFQSRVRPWMLACFGELIASDAGERNHRFLEEALELVQACGATQQECHQLVEYVYGRPTGEPHQEAGGVMVTSAALCLANGLDMHETGETELARIWGRIEQIREKQASKPKNSPLPQSVHPMPTVKAEIERLKPLVSSDVLRLIEHQARVIAEAREAIQMLHQNGRWDNGVTDPTGTIDEGSVTTGRYVGEMLALLSDNAEVRA